MLDTLWNFTYAPTKLLFKHPLMQRNKCNSGVILVSLPITSWEKIDKFLDKLIIF